MRDAVDLEAARIVHEPHLLCQRYGAAAEEVDIAGVLEGRANLVLGYGAQALVGSAAIKAAPGGVNSAAPLLAYHLGGELLLGVISAVAFATILAVVAGLTITASASFAHDIYAQVIKRGTVSPDDEV